jgi:mitochondrial-processing peptidase subunit beta
MEDKEDLLTPKPLSSLYPQIVFNLRLLLLIFMLSKLLSSKRNLISIPSKMLEHASLFPATQVTKLSNGVTVATQAVPHSLTSSIGVFIDAGSRDESAATNGAAHFLEHLAFKGTNKRTQKQLEQQIEDSGANLNAYTSREQTVYWLKQQNGQSTKFATDLLSDILLNSKITQEAVESEKPVILRESEEIDKSVQEVLLDKLHLACFRDSSLGYTILGPEENIRSMKRDTLIDYKTQNYTGDKFVVVATGDVDHKEFVKNVEASFGGMKSTNGPRKNTEKPYFCSSYVAHRNDEMGPTAHIAVGYDGVSWRSPDALAFMVMQQIVGSYNKLQPGIVDPRISGNRTINNVANKMGVGCADSFTAFNSSYRDTGLFGWYASCDEVAVEHLVGEMMFGFTSMAYTVTDEEVQRAKRELLTGVFTGMNDSTVLMEDLGRQLLVYGRRMEPTEFIKRLDAIDAEEIKRVAWNKLHDADITVVGMGPLHGLLTHYEVRKHTQWFRY